MLSRSLYRLIVRDRNKPKPQISVELKKESEACDRQIKNGQEVQFGLPGEADREKRFGTRTHRIT